MPFALGRLLRDGAAPLRDRRPADDPLTVTLILGPGHATPRDAGVPGELLAGLDAERVALTTLAEDEVEELLARPPAPEAEVTEGGALRISAARPAADAEPDAGAADDDGAAAAPAGLLAADVLLAAGWTAAPLTLVVPGARARAVLLTSDPPPLAHTGWTDGIATIGPSWLGGDLPLGADAAYVPMPVHRREDLVLIHGEEPFGLLAAAELHARRGADLSFAVSGVRADLELPFPFLGVDPGAEALAHAFASAAVAFAPPVRGWRPAALAMLACGQPVVAPDDDAARAALGPDTAILAAHPLAAADAAEHLIADWTDRGARVRAGMERVSAGWERTAAGLAAALRAL
ncbi:MAG TPA: hypothetical protein VFG42_22190 [Baekduia sp.]|uniref:hypothetical protein n=1 Tax=Baekduia sp. TaxID=2600305 RepID=UPI002D774650|nr:hypothetical protein [Baekduia sp.]HET6509525.1 hypothetical protein [Baekduia sp.]